MSDTGNKTTRGRTIALAGLFQAVRLVQQTARGKQRDPAATHVSIHSIFITSPDLVDAVYYGVPQLTTGLEVLCNQLGNDNKRRDLELTGYVISLLHLERKLARKSKLLAAISYGIDALNWQAVVDDAIPADIITELADIYTRTISTLSPRIMVQGEPAILESDESRNMVRALLLAGMRAAVLWRQCGGSRLKLVFGRKPLLECARVLLQEARVLH
jgi:high frequency lysogenization protein